MKNLLNTLLYVLLFSIAQPAYAVIGKITKLEHPITKQILLLADDVHLDAQKGIATQKQQQDLVYWLNKLKGCLKLEEMTAPHQSPSEFGLTQNSESWTAIKDRFNFLSDINNFIGSKSSESLTIIPTQLNGEQDNSTLQSEPAYNYAPMLGMTEKCTSGNVSVYNAECRFLTYEDTLPIKTFIDTYESIIKVIQSWQDDPETLQETYNELINTYYNHPFINELRAQLSDNPNATMEAIITDPSNYYGAYYDAVSPLLDARLLHSIHSTRDNKIAVSLFGADHHKNILNTLYALGYEQTAVYGTDYTYDQANNCCTIPYLNLTEFFSTLEVVHKPYRSILTSLLQFMSLPFRLIAS